MVKKQKQKHIKRKVYSKKEKARRNALRVKLIGKLLVGHRYLAIPHKELRAILRDPDVYRNRKILNSLKEDKK